MIALPDTGRRLEVVSGPEKVRNELRWHVRGSDGASLVLAELLPELAHVEALRRRYVYEARRLLDLRADCVAPILAIGPDPDPCAPSAPPPWRLRADPAGKTLARWLEERAPAPVEEAIELCAHVADAIAEIHLRGATLRDLEPRHIVIGGDDRIWFTDVGLARLDILSTRTASSLMLEASPYAAPEHLRSTLVDARADIYTIGALLWHALTGMAPLAEGSPLARDVSKLPPLGSLCPSAPDHIEQIVRACLAAEPDARPDSARDVADALLGKVALRGTSLARVTCQACGEPLRDGLRLCLACGREAVQFRHVESGGRSAHGLLLIRAREDERFYKALREVFEQVGRGPPPELNFLIGDHRMYSKAERTTLIKLPAMLFSNVSKRTALDLRARFVAAGIPAKFLKVKKANERTVSRWLVPLLAGTAGALAAGAGGGLVPAIIVGSCLFAVMVPIVYVARKRSLRAQRPPLATLRAAPAALPASDPLVARLAALLGHDTPRDVRARVGELALLVQRLCDRRGSGIADAAAIDLVTRPIEPLVGLIEREVRAIADIDAALRDLDEATLVRAIAVSDARGNPDGRRAELVAGLDRLRALEDTRAAHMSRLLEAGSLLRRSVEMALSASATDDAAVRERYVAMAFAALGPELDSPRGRGE